MKPYFATDLVITDVDGEDLMWELVEELILIDSKGVSHTVPRGYQGDLSSIPRLFWMIFPPQTSRKACWPHDYYYSEQVGKTRAEADQVLLEGMIAEGLGKVRRQIIYRAVRLGGWMYWNKRQREKKLNTSK